MLDTRLPEDFAADVDTVWELVDKLRREFDIPLSFIQDQADEPITLPAAEQTVEEVLRAIADRHEHYRCQAFGDRLVLRPSDPLFDVMISGVDVVEQSSSAVRPYLDHLRAFDPRFKDWHDPLLGIMGDPSENRVTLSPRAPLVLHFVQLLGRDRALFFTVPARRTFVSQPVFLPVQRMRINAQRPPADEAGEKQ